MESTQISISGWLDKENWYTYAMEYDSAIKEWNPVSCNQMNELEVTLSEITQS